jgi:hypothetical protein
VELRKCHQAIAGNCSQCKDAEERRQRSLKRDLDVQERRSRLDALHASRVEQIDQRIQSARDEEEERRLQEDREKALQQRRQDLEHLQQFPFRESSSQTVGPKFSVVRGEPGVPPALPPDQDLSLRNLNIARRDLPLIPEDSPEFEWQRQKQVDNAANDAIDAIMAMTGLKEVKTKFLAIKAKNDVIKRQKTDMRKERFGMVMLGNPGTGNSAFQGRGTLTDT